MSEAVKSDTAKADSAKEEADAKKEAEARRKAAEEQAERDEADIETFLSAHRGSVLARGHDSFVHEDFVAKREADRKRAEDEKE